MPIKISDSLPAFEQLNSENIFIMPENRALEQDIRPLKILILNLMPTKIETETQLLRLLSNSPLQIEIDLLQTVTYTSKNTPHEHLLNFYRTFDTIKDNKYDGLIITGAPVETMKFEDVDYWHELCEIMEWSKRNVYSTFHICWSAQAGLYYHYGIPKHALNEKIFGIYKHSVLIPNHMLTRGFDEEFYAPHSRYTAVHESDIKKVPELEILSISEMAGVYIAATKHGRQIFVTGHSEYDYDTLEKEYIRDKSRGLNINIPYNYFPNDDPNKKPLMKWQSHANLLYANWLNYFVYQKTPYDLNKLETY